MHVRPEFARVLAREGQDGELAARAGMVGRSLIALGIERGDRVGILMANGLDFTDLLFGASLIGAIPVLYNARFKARCTTENVSR